MDKHAQFREQYGPWALITGASAGIGEGFAWILAEQGINLILVARNQERLTQKAAEIQARYPTIQIKTHAADLSLSGSVEPLIEVTSGLEIGLAIPNAGMETTGSFLKHNLADEQRLIQLNISAPVHIAHHYGRLMSQRGRGGIILLSSIAGYGSTPYAANYSASKAYILSFGEALHYELKKQGIDVLVLSPGFTDTPMVANSGVNWAQLGLPYMDAYSVALAGLNALGKKTSIIPGHLNNILMAARKYLASRAMNLWIMGHLLERAIPPDRL